MDIVGSLEKADLDFRVLAVSTKGFAIKDVKGRPCASRFVSLVGISLSKKSFILLMKRLTDRF